jgi:hypothetical protein
VGATASTRVSTWRPFVSRDNGLTWSETVSPDVYHSTIGYHGSIIAMVVQTRDTADLLFTLNEGDSWNEQLNAWPLMTVEDVLHHDSQTDDFIVQGYRTVDRSRRGVIEHIDFESLNVRTCQGIQAPGTVTSDYEYYVPSTTAAGCLLGRVVKYVRRKQEAICVDNVDEQEKIVLQVRIGIRLCSPARFSCLALTVTLGMRMHASRLRMRLWLQSGSDDERLSRRSRSSTIDNGTAGEWWPVSCGGGLKTYCNLVCICWCRVLL